MSLLEGKIDQDHRYDSITNEYVLERVSSPGERHIAILLPGLDGRVGFFLNEIPVLETENPTIVRRKNSEVSFDTFDEANGNPVSNQFYINYDQEDSIVYLTDSEIGNVFVVQYTCKGTGQHVENIKSLMSSVIEFNTGLAGKFKKANLYDKVINAANVHLLGKRATVRNCLVQGSSVIRGNVEGKTSFFEVYGDLTFERDSVTDMSGVILIIHGSLKVSGAGAKPKIRGFDGVAGSPGSPGGVYIAGMDGMYGGNGGNGGNGGRILEMPSGVGQCCQVKENRVLYDM